MHYSALDGMLKVITLQALAVLLAAAVAGAVFDLRGAVSLLIGGAAYWLPNVLFVARLKAAAASGRASVVGFSVGELMKVAATVGVLVGAHLVMPDLHWIAVLVGLFVALKANLLAFLLKT